MNKKLTAYSQELIMPLSNIRNKFDALGQDPTAWSAPELAVAIDAAPTSAERAYLAGILDCKRTMPGYSNPDAGPECRSPQ